MTESEEKLIVDNMKFVDWYIGKKHNVKGISYHTKEDLKQACYEDICKYIHLYDPERGKISSFLSEVIDSTVQKLYNHEHMQKRYSVWCGLEREGVDDSEDFERPEVSCEYNLSEEVEIEELTQDIKKVIFRSDRIPRDQYILQEHFLNGARGCEISEQLGMSRQRVNQIIQRGKKDLKIILAAKGWNR